jgi:hypothetical protein
MSHHLDSPLARQDVRLDITDMYVFRGETGTALVMDVSHSLGEPAVPGFHPEGKYEFKIDTDGDHVEDVTYRFVFDERDAAGKQRFVLRKLTGPEAANDFADGQVIAQGVQGEEVTGSDGVRVWTGKAGDPFWIEPTVLHAVGHAFQDGTTIDLGDWTPGDAVNHFAGTTLYAIVLELPDAEIPAERINVWSLASLQTDAGGWRPINRFGLPMIHPLFTQYNEKLGDDLNAGRPADDFATWGETVAAEIAGVVRAYGTAVDPDAYGLAIAHRFLPNVMPYTVGTPAAFSFNGWNGRSLIDNAPNAMFSLAANTPVSLGIGRESVDPKPTDVFPYVPVVAE